MTKQNYYTGEVNVQVVVSLLKAYGISRVIASPGTTNLTFVASLQHDSFFKVYSAPEERSAAYMAVGMAEESGEPVVITCTGATASRNYLPALTEAFYRKLPVLAVTATQPRGIVGQYVPQVIDRSSVPADASVFSVHIPVVKDDADKRFAVLKTNEALHSLRKNGGGPVHINLETSYSKDFSVKELPAYKKVDFYEPSDRLPDIHAGRVGIFVGSHSAMGSELAEAIDRFCDRYGAVVYCDHTSNYKGRHRFQYPLVMSQDNWRSSVAGLAVMVHIGGVSGAYCQPSGAQLWRVNPDGKIRSVYGLPDAVFQMRELDFFNRYASVAAEPRPSFISECQDEYAAVAALIPESLPFSNIWVARRLSPMVPENAVMHFGILNSLRSWNFFELPLSVNTYCNVGGFGIDGPLSTAIGGALAQPDRLHFVVVGDLAFFYDMNSLGNRHLPPNLRILLVNNGRGTEFTNYNHPAYAFGADADAYMAAAGHYGHQSPLLVKHYAEDLGLRYLSASTKEDVERQAAEFMNPRPVERPMLFEVFTDSALENEALQTMRSLRVGGASLLENKARQILGRKGIETLKKFVK